MQLQEDEKKAMEKQDVLNSFYLDEDAIDQRNRMPTDHIIEVD